MKTVLYKVLIIFILPIVFTQCEKEPEPKITIPDATFLNALFNQGVDKNYDNIISPAEAEAITELRVQEAAISDLTGIEAFVNLEILWCFDNQLTSLDVSKNTALVDLSCLYNQLTSLDVSNNTRLTFLSCGSNPLTSLDVSKNTLLTSLQCHSNQLTNLDVSNNTALKELNCNTNQLTSLDFTNNTALTWLRCNRNQLTTLDVSNNTALVTLSLSSIPTLYEVCVWEMPFPPAGVGVDTTGSPNVYFTIECTGGK